MALLGYALYAMAPNVLTMDRLVIWIMSHYIHPAFAAVAYLPHRQPAVHAMPGTTHHRHFSPSPRAGRVQQTTAPLAFVSFTVCHFLRLTCA